MSFKEEILNLLENLLMLYEDEEKCGIFFKLEKGKNPSEIIGVLDFMKYKIKKWGNTNIFSYYGKLFEGYTILVIGSTNIREATIIIKYVYLTQIIKKNEEILDDISEFENIHEIEEFLSEEISKNMKTGYPSDPNLDKYLKNYIEKLLSSN